MLRILVVEDEFLLAAHIEDLLVDADVEVIGPVGTLDEAMKLAKDETMHGALLDVNIDGGRIDDVAAILAERDVPFVFVTGYGRANLPPLFQDAVVVAKPFSDSDLLREVLRMGPN
jgi:two-component SAPR family response regulator